MTEQDRNQPVYAAEEYLIHCIDPAAAKIIEDLLKEMQIRDEEEADMLLIAHLNGYEKGKDHWLKKGGANV